MNSFQTKYQIVTKIGEGTFSDVIKCVNKGSGEEFAAKRLKKIYRSEDSIQQCAEIIAWKKIPRHRNILNMLEYYYDFFTGQVIFVFGMMDMSLFEYMTHKKYPLLEEKCKGFMFQILCGLDHLHKCGFFHRDIKPENILIKFSTEGEMVKVADFGSIRGIYSVHPYTEYISTRWYRSPECLLTIGHYTAKMDIWAAACVFYEMLTFKPLFPGLNEIDQISKIHRVLGVPNSTTLNKLKPKSKNYIIFPRTKGLGLFPLLPRVSLECRLVLEQMLEYDPFKRINTKRLLRHSYFHDVKIQNKSKTRKNYDDGIKVLSPMKKMKREKTRPSSNIETKSTEYRNNNLPRSKSTGTKSRQPKDKKRCKSNAPPHSQNTIEEFIPYHTHHIVLSRQSLEKCKKSVSSKSAR